VLSIRAKLTLWYFGLAALVLAAFAVAIYFYFSRGLINTIDASLKKPRGANRSGGGHPSTIDEPGNPGDSFWRPSSYRCLTEMARSPIRSLTPKVTRSR
jgi:hypothetical protein